MSKVITALFLLSTLTLFPQQSLSARYVQDPTIDTFLNSTQYPDVLFALARSYHPQETDASCSLASAAMVINAFNHLRDEPIISQNDILSKANIADWTKKVQEGGDGVTLDDFGDYFEAALKAHSIHIVAMKILHADKAENMIEIEEKLHAIGNSPNCFIIANFDQGITHPNGSGGHFSPIGAYLKDDEIVLIMDVDREINECYWIHKETFFSSLNTMDNDGGKIRGIIYVELSD